MRTLRSLTEREGAGDRMTDNINALHGTQQWSTAQGTHCRRKCAHRQHRTVLKMGVFHFSNTTLLRKPLEGLTQVSQEIPAKGAAFQMHRKT